MVRGSLSAEAPVTVAVTGESNEDSRRCLVRGTGFSKRRVVDEPYPSVGTGLTRSDEPKASRSFYGCKVTLVVHSMIR